MNMHILCNHTIYDTSSAPNHLIVFAINTYILHPSYDRERGRSSIDSSFFISS